MLPPGAPLKGDLWRGPGIELSHFKENLAEKVSGHRMKRELVLWSEVICAPRTAGRTRGRLDKEGVEQQN
jgi:hypothetical protein